MATYPNSLPAPLLEGYALNPLEQTIRTEMETGSARVRRRTFAPQDRVSLQWIFTAKQFAMFRAFVDGEVGGGASWFTMTVDDGVLGYAVPRDVRFVKTFESERVGLHWKVRAEVDIRRVQISTFDHLNLLGFPSLDLDFAGTKGLAPVITSAQQPTPAVTFTRASTATYINDSGLVALAAVDEPRFDHDPVTLACRGLLIEEARTNLLTNSTIDGANLATQSVTTAATQYTLSFYGSGQIVISGTHSATVTGDGAYPTRKTLTFAPGAGTLTLTVSGTVKYSQLEAGAFATSYIPTGASSVTRSADVASMTGVNFSSWCNPVEGSIVVTASPIGRRPSGFECVITIGSSTTNALSVGSQVSGNSMRFVSLVGGAVVSDLRSGAVTVGLSQRLACAYRVNDFAMSASGGAVVVDDLGALPALATMRLGTELEGGSPFNGHIARLTYYPKRLTNSDLQTLSGGGTYAG